MGKSTLRKFENEAEALGAEAIKNPSLLPEIFKGVSSLNPKIKFNSAKTLVIISEKDPQKLYPQMDFFTDLLDGENNILRWNAMDVIANLTSVDCEDKFEEVFEQFYSLLHDESMISAGHVIDNSGKIAKAKPSLQKRITAELLKIEKIPRGQECKNILLGKAILSFDQYFDQIQNKDDVLSFVKRQLRNSRHATKVKAQKFLKKHLHRRRPQQILFGCASV